MDDMKAPFEQAVDQGKRLTRCSAQQKRAVRPPDSWGHRLCIAAEWIAAPSPKEVGTLVCSRLELTCQHPQVVSPGAATGFALPN